MANKTSVIPSFVVRTLAVRTTFRTRIQPQWPDQVSGEATTRGEDEQRVALSFAVPTLDERVALSTPMLGI
jgi:hypothetical protein